MSTTVSERDYSVAEIVAAVAFGTCIQVAAGMLFYFGQNKANANAAEISKTEQPVKVQPVLDTDLTPPKLGGKKAKLPDMWQRAPAAPQQAAERPPDAAAPSPKAPDDPTKIPDANLQLADAEVTPSDAEPPPDGGKADQSNDADTPAIDKDGGPANAQNEGSPEGKPDGSLNNMAASIYAGRLIAHVKRGGFVVSGSALPPEELKKLRVSAVIQLSGTTITGYSMSPSGDSACDSAARAKLEAAKGSEVPPPPEDHPEFLKPAFSVTFQCAN